MILFIIMHAITVDILRTYYKIRAGTPASTHDNL